MDSIYNLERLEEQVYQYNPSLKSAEQKISIRNHLRTQLLESKAVVRIQRLEEECESLMKSLKQKLLLLQDVLPPKDQKEVYLLHKRKKNLKYEDDEEEVKLNLSPDSSDEETLSSLISRRKEKVAKKKAKKVQKNEKVIETHLADTSEATNVPLPLALRRKPRERKLSYKSLSSSASTSHSKHKRSHIQNKQEHTVSTSGVAYHSEEMLVEQEEEEVDTTSTLHIKIPSLHRGHVHHIILDSLDFARKVFDYRANEVKEQQKQSSITHSTKMNKTRQKELKSITASSGQSLKELTTQEQELQLSQLIQDVMAETCDDETLQATNALENINNHLIGNYESIAENNFITYSQSSEEIFFSQNSNTNESCNRNNLLKKPRKNAKRSSNIQQEPPRKRGRKPKKKVETDNNLQLQPQPPTKSNLAKYVEFFANDCELLPGSTTPAASSTRSIPLVSSTTQHFEVAEQLSQENELQRISAEQQQPIMYYIDGDWANGGPCQLVPTSSVSIDARQLNQDDMNAPFQDFVNYIDNSGDSSNNVIAKVLEATNSLPMSIPLPRTNLGLQNKINYNHHLLQPQQIQSLSMQNSLIPIINIQIPSFPNNIVGTSSPPPAHAQKGVLDLSVKSKSFNINTNEVLNRNRKSSCIAEETNNDCCLPLDLSAKGCSEAQKQTEKSTRVVTIDNQDEEFIRRLIEQSEFAYVADELKNVSGDCSPAEPSYDKENNKSFKTALDMPLLDFDATDLVDLVDRETSKQDNSLTDKSNYNNTRSYQDSNYVSMTGVDSSLHFADQSTTDIFNKLLDICPNKEFLDDLSENVFEECGVGNSTMYEMQQTSNRKNLLANEKKDNYNSPLPQVDNQEKENTSDNESSSSNASLVVQINSSNNGSSSSDMILNLNTCTDTPELESSILDKSLKEIEKLNNCNITKEFSRVGAQKIMNEENNKTIENNEKAIENYQRSINSPVEKEHQIIDVEKNKITLKEAYDNVKETKTTYAPTSPKAEEQDVINVENIKIRSRDNKNDKYVNSECSSTFKNNLENDNVFKTKQRIIINDDTEKSSLTSLKNKSENDTEFRTIQTIENPKATFTCHSNNLPNKEYLAKDEQLTADEQNKNHSSNNNLKIPNSFTPKKVNDLKTENNNSKCFSNKKVNNIETASNTESKEVVVFSVAKITLSKDDIHFMTDSDASSEKSCDTKEKLNITDTKTEINKQTVSPKTYTNKKKWNKSVKNVEHDEALAAYSKSSKYNNENPSDIIEENNAHNISHETDSCCSEVLNPSISSKINFNDESFTEDMIICDIDDPEFCTDKSENIGFNLKSYQNTEGKKNVECISKVGTCNIYDNEFCRNSENMEDVLNSDIIDDTQSVECTNEVETPKAAILTIDTQNLTPLELESKLESTLDFNEDLDDALSLTTSCFDSSPNDDRFEDSIINTDDTPITTTTNIKEQETQQHTTNYNPIPIPTQHLKHFKIPKMNLKAIENTTVKKNEIDFKIIQNTQPKVILQKITMIPTNMEKITRTVKNDLVQTNQDSIETANVTKENEKHILTDVIVKVFGIKCLPFLVDRCYASTHCQMSHELNDNDSVYQNLTTLDHTNVNLAYRVLYNHYKLFKLYFTVFCLYYTNKNDRVKLLNMVNDCERYPECAEFIITIYEALVKCGFSRVNACRQILKRIRELTIATSIIEVLVTIIMKSDWTMFTDVIEKYTEEVYKFNYRIGILEQMAHAVLNSKGPALKQVFGKCVQTLHCDDTVLLLNSPNLIQCVALLTTPNT